VTTLLRVSGEIPECIRSGDWATVEEIVRHIDLTPAKLVKVPDFISEFEFIELDAGKKKIRITEYGKKL